MEHNAGHAFEQAIQDADDQAADLHDAIDILGIDPEQREAFTPAQIVVLRHALNNRTLKARHYISSAPDTRDQNALPTHIEDVMDLRNELRQLAHLLPRNLVQHWEIELGHYADRLQAFENYYDLLADGAPEGLGLRYEKLEDGKGGSRIKIDEGLLQLWTRLGFTDDHMSELIGCDRKTVQRRRAKIGIRKQDWAGLDPVELQPVRCSFNLLHSLLLLRSQLP